MNFDFIEISQRQIYKRLFLRRKTNVQIPSPTNRIPKRPKSVKAKKEAQKEKGGSMVKSIVKGYMTAKQVGKLSNRTDRNIRGLANQKVIRGAQITEANVWIFPVEEARDFIRTYKKKPKK